MDPAMTGNASKEQCSRATLAQSLFLGNLLLLPVLCFLALVYLYWRKGKTHFTGIALQHVRWAIVASVAGGGIIVGGCVICYLLWGSGGIGWMAIILAFTILHVSFVLLGIVSLSRAMTGEPPVLAELFLAHWKPTRP